ncbi:MAG: hypothetical protein Q7S83_02595 [bacterium]|nr:hypothetical protein [bacterium]
MLAIVVLGLALIALCLVLIFLTFVGGSSRVLFEGVLDFVETEDLFGKNPRTRYFFSTYFAEPLRSDGRLLAATYSCVLPLGIQNDSGAYIPREGHNIKILVRWNIFGEPTSFKIERLPDLNPDDLYQLSQSIDAGLD